MRKMLLLLLVCLVACRVWSPPGLLPIPTASHPATPSPLPTETTASSPPAQERATATLPYLGQASFRVQLHPDGPLYIGDQVSFEVIAPAGLQVLGRVAQVSLKGVKIAGADFGLYGIAGRQEAVLRWVWDTSSLAAGEYTLDFSVTPNGPAWTETVRLGPRGQVPLPEATWATAHNQCCTVHYLTGSAAERDLDSLLAIIDEQAQDVSRKMGVAPGEPIEITLLPRVLGHGGFASKDVSVSYLDRNYMGGDFSTILHHELVHILDSRLGGDLRPSLFVEGLAVYLSGGHYRAEPLLPRAAALLPAQAGCQPWVADRDRTDLAPQAQGCGLGLYVPLTTLFDHFYFEQHETSYLEAAALVQFMVETWGWDAFSAFYRDIHQQPEPAEHEQDGLGSQSRAVDAALHTHFGLTLEELEKRFITELQQEQLTPENAEDVRLEVRFYDAARSYQLALDPSAYFMTAWAPEGEEMRERGIVADYVRHPAGEENLALETMLAAASENRAAGDFARTDRLLTAVEIVLEAFPGKGLKAFDSDPLAADYLALVQAAQQMGYQPQQIDLNNGTARMLATLSSLPQASGPQITILDFVHQQDGWRVMLGSGWWEAPGATLAVPGMITAVIADRG